MTPPEDQGPLEAAPVPAETKTVTVALVGNPNCGKTSLYNAITGTKENVGNYPRVTVKIKHTTIEHRGWEIRLVDLPGIYSLTSQSPEERIGRDFIQYQRPDIVLNVLDAGNLARNLFLTTQLIEMGRPRLYALNMADEAHRKGITVDLEGLESILGGHAIETVATTGAGVTELLDHVIDVATNHLYDQPKAVPYDNHLEEALDRVQDLVRDLHPGALEAEQSRWLAIKLLEGDDEILRQEGEHGLLIEMVRRERFDLARHHGEDTEIMFSSARYGFIHGLISEVCDSPLAHEHANDLTHRLDRLLLNRWLGMPIFFGLMWLMFETTFTLGNYPADWIDGAVSWISDGISALLPAGLVHDLIIDGVVTGMGAVIVFLPYILILFFFIAMFSETGYLARSSFLVDRAMHLFGLHGKAFIPLVMGFGCNVPAVMASRTIESPQARLVAILINPFMSCSQRLPAFILLSGAFFAENAGQVIFAMYLISIATAMGAAVFLTRFVVRGGTETFIMELPPYRLPTIGAILYHMWDKAWDFVRMVGGVIVVGSVVVWFLQAFPQEMDYSRDYDGEATRIEATQPEGAAREDAIATLRVEQERERVENSYLGRMGQAVSPVFAPLGFNWQDTVSIITGFFAKEMVVASYAVLYGQNDGSETGSEGLRGALAGAMTPITAFALMVFLLLYSPCMSTFAAIKREAGGWNWALFSLGFSLVVGWLLAFAVVQVGALLG
ncbi:ferrous iron transport protein B [Magnetospira sp. QH-2]|uniref:ferrous iron transport protein B n=1 Tax=Magnetospira sp. (strain QH-2) TaxID=1288970 RepID=UPI0003E813F0|nr:ferrous iron transport protein B [Magnetospira sp. QH-2]CCQ75007.1 Ferrous iron transport protein B [Magnetospira sp. QH-2]